MPGLRAYAQKPGYYIKSFKHNWTLQVEPRAGRFFDKSTHYHDDDSISLTVVKALVHLGEAKTQTRKSKADILGWFPRLNPSYCEMRSDQQREFVEFCERSLEQSGLPSEEFDEFVEFLRYETPMDPISWNDDYSP